jgi:hypothetical protein
MIPPCGDSAGAGLPADADRRGAYASDPLGRPPRPRLPLDALDHSPGQSGLPPFGTSDDRRVLA